MIYVVHIIMSSILGWGFILAFFTIQIMGISIKPLTRKTIFL